MRTRGLQGRRASSWWTLALACASVQALAQDLDAAPDPGLRFEASAARGGKTFSHKIFARMSGGMISNVGTSTGSTVTYGGANIGGVFYFRESLAVGAAYKIESNFNRVPLKGWDLFGRYYVLAPGTAVTVAGSSGDRVLRHRSWSPYVGAEFSSRDYVFVLDPLAPHPEDQSLTGSASAANAIVGLDYRWNRHWETSLETSYTVFPFGGTDARVRIKWMLVSVGLNYVF